MYTSDLPLKQRLEKDGLVLLPKLLSNVELDTLNDQIDSDQILQAKKEIMQSTKIITERTAMRIYNDCTNNCQKSLCC